MKANLKEAISVVSLAEKYGVGRVIFSNLIPVTEDMIEQSVYGDNVDFQRMVSQLAVKSLETNVGIRLPEFTLKTERRCEFIENLATCITWDGKVTPCYNFLHNYVSYIYGVKKEIKQIVFRKHKLSNITRNMD